MTMNSSCLVELLTPKIGNGGIGRSFDQFAGRYNKATATGYVVSIPDNPMGELRHKATELIEKLGLPAPRGRVLLHLNTYHSRDDIDAILNAAIRFGTENLLLVSGDGGESQTRIKPSDLGLKAEVVTAVGLLEYVHREYSGVFYTGVAFNPYEPQDQEIEELKRKIDSGAQFIVTQPVIGMNENVRALRRFQMPVYVGAWMSRKLNLLSQCVGYPVPDWKLYDPVENLLFLKRRHTGWGLYLSMLAFDTQLPEVVDLLAYEKVSCPGGCSCRG